MRILYDYFRSSASYRVRIALNLKGLSYRSVPVALLDNAQQAPEYLEKNPQGLIPALLDGDQLITQSLAICEYLDEVYPTPSLLPTDALGRARVRALALSIACDIHPLNNLRVLRRLEQQFSAEQAKMRGTAIGWTLVYAPLSGKLRAHAASIAMAIR